MSETLGRGARCAWILLTVAALTILSMCPAEAADVQATIDFDVEALPKGTVLSEVYADDGESNLVGPISVLGTIPGEPENRALIFDSSLRTGGDTDLGSPHTDFGGPGIGSGGAAGAPYQNNTAQHRILILAENLIDNDGDGLIDSPDDAVVYGMLLEFDFQTIQAPFVPAAVSVHAITTLDAEGSNPGEVRFYDAANQLVATTQLISGGNNGRVTQQVGLPGIGVFGVARMEFQLNGSSAIDDVQIELHAPAAPPTCEITEAGSGSPGNPIPGNGPISVAVGDEVCFDVTGSTTASTTGAACLPDGSCLDGLTASQASALGASFQGEGSTCETANCVSSLGACCLPSGECADGMIEADCVAIGGAFGGIGSDCATSSCTAPPSSEAGNVHWNFTGCYAFSHSGSFSEFFPTITENCSGLTVSASIVDQPNGGHSCTSDALTGAGGGAFCVDADSDSSYDLDDEDDTLVFEVTLSETEGSLSSLKEFSFYHMAPEIAFTHQTSGSTGSNPNNPPQLYGLKVYRDGAQILFIEDQPTSETWTQNVFSFEGDPNFEVASDTVTFRFELQGYAPEWNGASKQIWDLDEFNIAISCTEAPPQTGGCCLPYGCQDLTAADCSLLGGSFAGEGASCAANACASGGSCTASTTVNQFQVEFLGVANNANGTSTWTYTVMHDATPPELSHFTIGFCESAVVVSSSPAGAEVGTDGSTGTFGIKWETDNSIPVGVPVPFSFTLADQYFVDSVTFAAKAGPSPNFGSICGASCAPTSCPEGGSVHWDLTGCLAYSDNTNFSEFTPSINEGVAGLDLSASIVEQTNGMHSCTSDAITGAGGGAFCVKSSTESSYDHSDSQYTVRFDVSVTESAGKIAAPSEFSFYHAAPWTAVQHQTNGNYDTYSNDPPQLYGLKVLRDGVQIYFVDDLPTSETWTQNTFNFEGNPQFEVSNSSAVFTFELLAYAPTGQSATLRVWDLDELDVSICCRAPVPDCPATVVLDAVDIPATATASPALPADSAPENSVTSTICWTPTAADVGTHTFEFEVTDCRGAKSICEVEVIVECELEILASGQPQGLELCEGESASFLVNATAIPAAAYQWFRNGSAIPGANAALLDLGVVTASDAGSYTVTLTSACGTVTSEAALLVVNTAPEVDLDPETISRCLGEATSFTATISGTEPLTLVWKKDGVAIPGESMATLSLTDLDLDDAGSYTLTATNECGTDTSAAIVLVVKSPAEITVFPTGPTVCAGESATFTVTATGTAPLSYQWSKNGTEIPGATRALLHIASVMPADAGAYTVTVSNSCAEVTTPAADLVVRTAPEITAQPASTTECTGTAITLTIAATGSTPLTIEWKKNGTILPGESGASLSIASAAVTDSGSYSATVANDCGSATSETAVVVVREPPTVIAGLQDQTLCEGEPLTLSVTAAGSTPLDYSWTKEGIAIPGADSSTLTIPAATLGDSGYYEVTVTNDCGSASSSADVEVRQPPTVVTGPEDLTLCEGESATFSVTATGTAPLSYQWNYNGAPIAGANADILTLSSITIADMGTYTVTVTNDCGSTTCDAADLTVRTPAALTLLPTDQTLCDGAALHLTAAATGSGPIAVQWSKNGSPIAGATSLTLSIDPVSPSDAGSYTVTVSNDCGEETSPAAAVVVREPPTIVTSPIGETLCEGESITFTVTATGSEPLDYQWKKNGVAVPGANGANLTIVAATPADAGSYSVVVSNDCGSRTSDAAVLIVETPVTLITSPADQTVCEGETIALSITVTGTTPITYQWFMGSTPLFGATGSSLTIHPASSADAGTYSVTATNACDSVTASAEVTVREAPTIVTPPEGLTLCEGESAVFTVSATGSEPLAYLWRKNGSVLVGEIGSTLEISSVTLADTATYSVSVQNDCGTVTCTPVTLEVRTAPLITLDPVDREICTNASITLTAAATGSTPLEIEWTKNGVAIPGANGLSLSLSGVTPGDSGVYSVTVTNDCGTATSETAVVTINEPPTIIDDPDSLTLCEGEAASFSVTATGTALLEFQWKKNGSPIPGATASTFSIATVELSDTGAYSVTVSNECGARTSAFANLTVQVAPTITTPCSGQTLCEGETIELSITAFGTPLLTYQWSMNNAEIPGATSATLTIPGATLGDAGSYSVTVTNQCGSETSSATVEVLEEIEITAQPLGLDVCVGELGSLTVVATGEAPINYSWRRNGALLAGQNGPTLDLGNVELSEAGIYVVTLTNICGSVNSSPALVEVRTPALITDDPEDADLCVGVPLTLSIEAVGTAPLTIEWSKDGTTIPGANGLTLTVPAVSTDDEGTYTVTVTNDCGSDNAYAEVEVDEAPTTEDLADQVVCEGETVVFSSGATGSSPLTITWKKNGVTLGDATGPILTLNNVSTSDAGTYSVAVTNECGTANSSAELTIRTAPAIVTGPADASLCIGEQLVLTASASGSAPLAFSWTHDGAPILGATGATLDLGAVGLADAGTYIVTVTNDCGTDTATAEVEVAEPPAITLELEDQIVCTGADVTFTAAATGSAPLTYSWTHDGAPLPGQSGPSLTLTSVSTGDAGSYAVTVTNECGSATSTATLEVQTPALITVHPQGDDLCTGDSLTLTVVAIGTGPLTYQWFLDGAPIAGETSDTLLLTSASSSDEGNYTVTVSNECGADTCGNAFVGVDAPPAITAFSSGQTICAGDSATFLVTATGSAPLSYLWTHNGTPLAETGASLTVTNATTADAGTYAVTVTNECGTADANAELAVETAPTIVTGPAGAFLCTGELLTLSATATGSAPLAFSWTHDGAPILGATGATLDLGAVGLADAGTYIVTVTNDCGTDTATAEVEVAEPPAITLELEDQIVCTGADVTFTAAATGSAPLTYSWTHDGAPLPGQSGPSMTLTSVSTGDAGSYAVTVTNECGSATSTATLEVQTPALITVHPQGDDLCTGDTLTLTVVAIGTGPLTYQWFLDGAPIPGETSDTLLLTSASSSDEGNYTVTVSNECGADTCGNAFVGVDAPPAITAFSSGQTICAGDSATFLVTATGSAPLSYLWTHNGTPLAETGASLTVTNATTADAGTYAVTVTNECGTADASAELVVETAPTIVVAPIGASLCAGELWTLTAIATGSAPLTYVWAHNGITIPGATSATLDLGAVQLADAGSYTVTVTNDCGSDDATTVVEVTQPPAITLELESQTVCSGESVTFTVAATGTAPLNYSWTRDGAPLVGQNGSSLTLPSVSNNLAGTYAVTIENGCGSETSAATLEVKTPALITVHPQGDDLCIGDSLTLTVVAIGTGPLAYQWFLDGAPISGETSDTLDLTSASSDDEGNYTVTVSNECGSDTCGNAFVDVDEPPSISGSPGDQAICTGESATFFVIATGSDLEYSWKKDGLPLGEFGTTLTISAATPSDSGLYTVMVTNDCGTVTTTPAELIVNDGVEIVEDPLNQEFCTGEPIFLSIGVTGSDPITYQWSKDGVELTGETGPSLSILSAELSDAGTYTVVTSNACDADTASATVVVRDDLEIVTHLIDEFVCEGGWFTLVVEATGTEPLSYSWTRNGVLLPEHTGPTLMVNVATPADGGLYEVTVTNPCGGETSSATVEVGIGVEIEDHEDVSIEACEGDHLEFTAPVQFGSEPISFQWFKDGQELPGETGLVLVLDPLATTDAGVYTVSATNACDADYCAPIAVTVNTLPEIAVEPLSQSVCWNESFTLTATASSASSFTLQWFLDGAPIAGATSSTLVVDPALTADSGTYTVTATNDCGSVSASSEIEVVRAPLLTSSHEDQNLCAGETLFLSAGVIGGEPITYQWIFNGTPIPGATDSTFTIPAVTVLDGGTYTVAATNACGNDLCADINVLVEGALLITNQPTGSTLCEGGPIALAVEATGSSAISYQWSLNGAALPGATDATLLIDPASSSDSGDYTVTISNECGSVTSTPAIVEVREAPAIVTQPTGDTICAGDTLAVMVIASGSEPIMYQWHLDGAPIAGARRGLYSVPSAQVSDGGEYTVTITNSCGSTSTIPVTIEVLEAVEVLSSPSDQDLCEGESFTLEVDATGGASLTYQWFKDGVALPGANGPTIAVASASAADSGVYSVTLTNECGSTNCTPATVTVAAAPAITASPLGGTLCEGASITLSASATGGAPLTFQWFLDGAELVGENSATLSIGAATLADAGLYSVTAENDCGLATSDAATLEVVSAPEVTSNPIGDTLCAGASITFTATATGSGLLSFQWTLDGTDLPGETGASLTIPAVAPSDTGLYAVTVTNECGSETSAAAELLVEEPRAVTLPPASQEVCEGEDVTFTTTVTGTSPLTLQWRKDGADLPGENAATLFIPATTPEDAGSYDLVITNACGTETSAPANLTVDAGATISSQPLGGDLCVGDSLTLSVTATGTDPLTYQWSKDGSEIPGANASTLDLTSATLTSAGLYSVEVSNDCGAETSTTILVEVLEAPEVTLDPNGQDLCEGATLALTVEATGTTPLTVEWRKDGTAIAGAISTTLTIPAITVADAGSYDAMVTNACGEATSLTAVVTVAAAPAVTLLSASEHELCEEATLTLEATVSGSALALQWQKDGVDIPGAHDAIFTIATATPLDSGLYQLLVEADCGTVASETITVTVLEAPLILAMPEGDDLLCPDQGNSHTFTVDATGSEPLTYQWYKDGAPIVAATSQNLTLVNITDSDYASYTCEVSNGCGTATTTSALLLVPFQGMCEVAFQRGDCNADALIDIGDAIYIMRFSFQSFAPPQCMDPCDNNDDGMVDITDTIFLLSYIFAGGNPPPAPAMDCGLDPTDDSLPCMDFNACGAN